MSPIVINDFGVLPSLTGNSLYDTNSDFTFVASIEAPNHYYCSGTIIDAFLILTAAHCLVNLNNGSEFDPKSVSVGIWGRKLGVRRVIVHEDYNFNSHENDIALLILDKALNFNLNYVSKISYRTEPGKCTGNITALTWKGDFDSVTVKDYLSILEQEKCSEIYHDFNKTLGDSVVCTGEGGTQLEGSHFCDGYSGGPVVCSPKENGQLVMLGVTSRGLPCNGKYPEFTGIYTDVSKYAGWIKKTKREYSEFMFLNDEMKELEDKLEFVENQITDLKTPLENKTTTTERVPSYAHVQLFSEPDLEGFKLYLTLNGCRNKPASYPHTVESVNTHGSCVIMYAAENCTGRRMMIHPYHRNPNRLNDPISFKACSDADETPILRKGQYVDPRKVSTQKPIGSFQERLNPYLNSLKASEKVNEPNTDRPLTSGEHMTTDKFLYALSDEYSEDYVTDMPASSS